MALSMPLAHAQDRSAAVAPATAELQYRSTFEGYRGYNEQAVTSWREANDKVGKIGGWRSYAREAGEGGAAAGDVPVQAPAQDHGKRGGQDGQGSKP
jgi:hypothetical protein